MYAMADLTCGKDTWGESSVRYQADLIDGIDTLHELCLLMSKTLWWNGRYWKVSCIY